MVAWWGLITASRQTHEGPGGQAAVIQRALTRHGHCDQLGTRTEVGPPVSLIVSDRFSEWHNCKDTMVHYYTFVGAHGLNAPSKQLFILSLINGLTKYCCCHTNPL